MFTNQSGRNRKIGPESGFCFTCRVRVGFRTTGIWFGSGWKITARFQLWAELPRRNLSFYCLFAPRRYFRKTGYYIQIGWPRGGCISGFHCIFVLRPLSRSWLITQSTQHHRRACNSISSVMQLAVECSISLKLGLQNYASAFKATTESLVSTIKTTVCRSLSENKPCVALRQTDCKSPAE